MWPKLPRPEIHAALALCVLLLPGCIRLDMYNQPRHEPLEASRFYADGRSARPLPAGTVARGTLQEDTAFATGMVNDSTFTNELPFALTPELLQRGRERYGIFCAVCHDATGGGRGMVVRRGYKQPPALHIERLRQQPAGYFFDVISRGFATMPSYAAQITPADRWAIVAYVRALQLSQHVPVQTLPEPMRGDIGRAAAAGRRAAAPTEGKQAAHE